jgi:glycerol-3-phosphate acyltransferase PlsX
MKQNRVILDAMGGDNAPYEIVKGAVLACKESSTLKVLLVGDQELISSTLRLFDLSGLNFEIFPASQVISMKDAPREAVDEKEDASINVACRILAEDQGDAMVSAGNTGATIISCARHLPKIDGIEKGALAAIFPAMKNTPSDPGKTIMLDVGATLHCTVSQLIQFGIMGVHYAREVFEIEKPRVGLLNIGEEETKGHDILIDTYSMLKKMDLGQFIGNVEGKDIMRGIADVIISEGMTGNIVLKALEGAAEMGIETGKRIWKKSLAAKLGLTLLAPMLKKVKKRVDYSEYGGAPILGFRKLVIKSHGRSNAKAIKNALLMAERSLKHDLVLHMGQDIQKYNQVLFEVF